MQRLLARQVDGFGIRDNRQAAILGIVTTVAAVSSMIAQPVMGALSDHSRNRPRAVSGGCGGGR